MRRKTKRRRRKTAAFFFMLAVGMVYSAFPSEINELLGSFQESPARVSIQEIPDYSGEPYIEIDGNIPDFQEEDFIVQSYEFYSQLDYLGRCGKAYANVGTDLMPVEERGQIGQVRPSGWHTIKYDNIDGKYLYNRCHLIGYQLTGENSNERNLITGTRYMNVQGMLPFENRVADYVKHTGNHVLYRVTPVFQGNNLVASGVRMEAESVEDRGDGIRFHVYVYNVQPGIAIDYATGESWDSQTEAAEDPWYEDVTDKIQEFWQDIKDLAA